MKSRRWILAFTLAALFGAAVAWAGTHHAPPPGFHEALAAHDTHTDRLLTHSAVVGTAVGIRGDGSAVVKVYTKSPNASGLPDDLDGVPVEIETTGEIVAHGPTDVFPRPVPIGVSSGSARLIVFHGLLYCTGGTIGARVTDGSRHYALSAAHVYALQGSRTNGTVQVGATTGDRILQPGRVDMAGCGTPSEITAATIGRLVKYVPITFSFTAHNTVDAAIALSSTGALGNGTPAEGYGIPSSTTAPAVLGMAVQKYGRTTGSTAGTITGINATILVRYDRGIARFVNQIVVNSDNVNPPFSAGGDSGALIVTDDGFNSPVALLFAGSSTMTIGNPIALVLQKLGVTIDGP